MRDSRWWPLGVVIGIAVSWRVLLWWTFPLVATNDSDGYFKLALGMGEATGWFDQTRTPIYPAFLSVVLGCFGPSARAIVAAQAVVGLGSTALYYRIGELAGGRFCAVLAGLFVASHASLLLLEHALLTETLALFLQGLTVLLACRVLRTRRRVDAVMCGVVAAAASLCRPNLLVLGATIALFLAGCAAMAAIRRSTADARSWVAVAAVFGATFVVSLAPWLWQTHRATGAWGLGSLGNVGRLVFAIREGFVPDTTPALLVLVPDLPARCRENREACAWMPDRMLREQGATLAHRAQVAGQIVSHQIRNSPESYVRATWRATLELLGIVDGRITETLFEMEMLETPARYVGTMTAAEPEFWPRTFIDPDRMRPERLVVARAWRSFWRFTLPWLPVAFAAVTPVLLFRRETALIVWLAVTLVASLAGVLAVTDRYTLLIEPLMWIGVTAGIARVVEWTSRRRRVPA